MSVLQRRSARIEGGETCEVHNVGDRGPKARDLDRLRQAVGDSAGAGELAYRHGEAMARDAILIRAATGLPPAPGWQDEIAKGATATFPVRPADLMPQYAGAELGRRLAEVEARWIASGFTLSREQLLA